MSSPMALPEDFVRRIISVFEPDGEPWLAALPGLIEACARRWGLTVGPPVANLSYNYVAPATLADGTPAMLKLGVPRDELSTEIDALRHYAGAGAARLLEADEVVGALLLERLVPGETLVALSERDDEAATRAAAAVMARLWRPPPAAHRYPTVADWFAGLARLRPHFGGESGPFPARLVARAEAITAALLATQAAPVVLHGDLHHENILAAGAGWLAIDPKGVVGEPAYEAGALLRNPIPQIRSRPHLGDVLAGRIAILAAAHAHDPRRLHGWGLAQALLSAWWSYEDGGDDPAGDLVVVLALDQLDPAP